MEINIYFKNVGQGDTIVLDWFDMTNNFKKFALIDCNIVNGRIDSLIKHIENHQITEFEFVLMSHPHSDHFSGFLEFFEYCELSGILIKKFMHTSFFNPTYLKVQFEDNSEFKKLVTSSVNRRKHKITLWRIFKYLLAQEKSDCRFIKDIQVINNDYRIALTDDLEIVFLSPFAEEIMNYVKATFRINTAENLKISQKLENNPKANLLSSLLQLTSKKNNFQIILCSDVSTETFARLMKDKDRFYNIKNKKLLAAQIPHHGSLHNHIESFWSQISSLSGADIIISVGEGYGHPNISVVQFFDQVAQSIHATNFVGGYKNYFLKKNYVQMIEVIPDILDLQALNFIKTNSNDYNIHDLKTPFSCCEKRLNISIDKKDNLIFSIFDM